MEGRPKRRKRAASKEVRFGSYVLRRRLAVGGMAEVFLAQRVDAARSDPPIVIKRILPQLAEDPAFVQMFADEARLVAQLEHPNIVKVFDFGEVEGQCYLAMEHVDGLDAWRLLRRYARAKRKMPPSLAALICMDVLRGLEHVHSAVGADGVPLGVVHSDISPSNVYVSKTGQVKIGDFGIAHARRRRERAQAGTLTGKYGYMAPEQVLGRTFDSRADLFGVGVVLAELLTGEPLFTGTSKLTVLLAVRDVRIEPLREKASEFPHGFMEILLRALARDPTSRFLDAEEFRLALEEMTREAGQLPDARALGDAVTWAATVGEAAAAPSGEPRRVTFEGHETPARTPTRREQRYVFREPDDTTSEPVDFARAVERVVTGQLSPETEVSVDGQPFVPVERVPELGRHMPAYVTATDILRTPAPEAAGEIDMTTVVSLLGRIILSRGTGLIVFEWDPARKEVYLVEGRPEFVSSNLAGELLGEFLVSRRILTRGELDMALAVMPRFGGHLGETLVALGLVDPVRVVRHIAEQVKDKLLELFRWRKGKYTFFRATMPPETGFPLGLDPVDILCDGVRAGYSLQELDEWLSSRGDRVVVRASDAELPASLPPVQRRVLEQATGPVSLADILARHRNADRVEVMRALLLGYETGMLVEPGRRDARAIADP